MNDELEVNSIERFSKKSDRLILEELGSCEVPAGCGGLVLRWFSMEAGLPIGLQVFRYRGEIQLFCNGEPMTNGYATVAYGQGAIAIHVDQREESFDWFYVMAIHSSRTRRDQHNDRQISEMSASLDGSWKFTLDDPGESWASVDFDDSRWSEMQPRTMPLDELPENEQWRFRRLEKEDKPILSIPQQEVWIRKRFDISGYVPGGQV